MSSHWLVFFIASHAVALLMPLRVTIAKKLTDKVLFPYDDCVPAELVQLYALLKECFPVACSGLATGEVGNLHWCAAIACRNICKFYKAAPKGGVIYVHVKWQSVTQAMDETAVHCVVNPTAAT